jgi:hypothetical protein
LDPVDLAGYQAMSLPVNLGGSVRRGGFYQAEDPAGLLVDPVPQVADVVIALRFQVGKMCLGDVVHRHAAGDLVDIHEERHWLPSLRSSDLSQRP